MQITLSTIAILLSIIGIIFSVYHFFRNPQIDLDKRQALNEERDKNKATLVEHERSEGQINLINEKLKWEREENDKKFAEMGKKMDASMALAQNHIHTIDTKVDKLTQSFNAMNTEMVAKITELATIIKVRMPEK